MRERKVRGKRADSGKWVYGDLLQDENRYTIYNISKKPGVLARFYDSVIPETVGDYIGHKDINGKEIYEGDILRHPDGMMFTVIYSVPDCGYKAKYTDGSISPILMQIGDKGLAVVIGNVHDNPELIEE
jgi:uncharacterized phage protein (TIGR01671 family)